MKRGVEEMVEGWSGREESGGEDNGSFCGFVNAKSLVPGSSKDFSKSCSSGGESLRFLWEDVVTVNASLPKGK